MQLDKNFWLPPEDTVYSDNSKKEADEARTTIKLLLCFHVLCIFVDIFVYGEILMGILEIAYAWVALKACRSLSKPWVYVYIFLLAFAVVAVFWRTEIFEGLNIIIYLG